MEQKHLPVIGVGPVIVIPQIILTIAGFIFSKPEVLFTDKIMTFDIPFVILGIVMINTGAYLWFCANYNDKILHCIKNNKLLTTGVYSIVRNPVYSSFFLICTGIIFISRNWFLLIIPLICWAYMSVFLKFTEEKWLHNLYGNDYDEYCKKVNRCIPWIQKKI